MIFYILVSLNSTLNFKELLKNKRLNLNNSEFITKTGSYGNYFVLFVTSDTLYKLHLITETQTTLLLEKPDLFTQVRISVTSSYLLFLRLFGHSLSAGYLQK